VWTQVGAGQAACGTCHGRPPATGRHAKHISEGKICADCHAGTVRPDGTIIPDLHVNGVKDVVFRNGGRFDGTTCTGVCHGSQRWR
jgi:hypothetical protein